MFELSKIRAAYPDLCLLNGFDEIFINALPVGIQGAIGSTYNIMPEKFSKILKAFKAGDLESAAQTQKQANEIIDILIKTDVKSGIKYILTKAGIPCGSCRRPFAPLNKEKTDLLDKVLELL